jgi:hypothetical protein
MALGSGIRNQDRGWKKYDLKSGIKISGHTLYFRELSNNSSGLKQKYSSSMMFSKIVIVLFQPKRSATAQMEEGPPGRTIPILNGVPNPGISENV